MRRSILTVNFETEGVNPRLCQNSRDSINAACERWGCDFIELNHQTMQLTFAPAAEKTKLFTEVDAEHVLLLDSDVVVNSKAPNPFELFPIDQMVVVHNATDRWHEYGQIKQIERQEWNIVEAEFGQAPYVPEHYFNSGMMLVHKDFHSKVFELARKMHIICCEKYIGLNWVDQTLFNWATKKLGTPMLMVDETWNYVHPDDLGPDWMNMKKNIYHFAGMPARNEQMKAINWK